MAQSKKAVKPPKPVLGFNAQIMLGKYRFPATAMYNQHPFDDFQTVALGGYAQLFLSKRFFLRPEVSLYERTVKSPGRFEYNIKALGQDVEFVLNGTQKVTEIGLIGGYRFLNGALQPVALMGFSTVLHRDKMVQQQEYGLGAQYKADMINKEADVTFIVDAGADYRITRHLLLQGGVRYSIGQTTFQTPEQISKFLIQTNVYIQRYMARLGLAWQF